MPFLKYPRGDSTKKNNSNKGKKRRKVSPGRNKSRVVNGNDDEEIPSDLEEDTFRKLDESLSDEDNDFEETAQEKRLKLAKKYLEEIEKEEQERAESSEIAKNAIAHRLKEDNLLLAGKLRKNVADQYVGVDTDNIHIFRCKDHKLSITCIVISNDDLYLYSGSKDGVIVKWSIAERKRLLCIPSRSDRVKKNPKWTVNCLAISSDDKFLASGDDIKRVQIWKPEDLSLLKTFTSHRDAVTGLAFRFGSHQLFSVSKDRTVKLWSIDEMCYVETMYGHICGITAVDAMTQERAITSGGSDNTIRLWQVVKETQLVFKGHVGNIEMVKFVNEGSFLSCGDDGELCLWGLSRKKPLCSVSEAHGKQAFNNEPNWISSITSLINTDLVASGSCDGVVKLWKCDLASKSLTSVIDISVLGFANSLQFAHDGRFLAVGVGQEHRLGRWTKVKEARNGIILVPLVKKTETTSSS